MEADNILAHLKEQGKITDEDIAGIEYTSYNEDIKELAFYLHLLLCEKDHDEGECTFLQEEQMSESWLQPAHSKWSEYAIDQIQKYDISPSEALTEMTGPARIVCSTVPSLSNFGLLVVGSTLNKIYSQRGINQQTRLPHPA